MERRLDRLYDAIMSAFTVAEMERLLRSELEIDMATIATTGNKSEQFFEVVQAAERGGWLHSLAVAAFKERSGNEKIQLFFDDYIGHMAKGSSRSGRIMLDGPYTYDNTDSSLRERVRNLEIRVSGIDGDNGIEARLRAIEIQLGKQHSRWITVLQWLIVGTALFPLLVNALRAAGWL